MKELIKPIDENTINILRQISQKFFSPKVESQTPVAKLLRAYGHNETLHYNANAAQKAYCTVNAPQKRWLANILPVELLSLSFKEALEIVVTLSEGGIFYKQFPENIETPDYGDKWGRSANYIEINNRALAQMNGTKCSAGIISAMKLLCAIPPSAKSWANCVILSQIFPNIFGDGFNKAPWEENSMYGLKLGTNYSSNIIDNSIIAEVSPEEQFRAFNDIAHFRGIKTGFRTIISEDQLKVVKPDGTDVTFRWSNPEHVELYIQEHVKLIKLGFEAVFVDSAKHIGGYDWADYTGVGALPGYEQMQYILYEIRRRSGCNSVSFVGEKSSCDFERYRQMGLTAGTALLEADNIEDVKYWSCVFKYCRDYAPGVEVSNDNDVGGRTYEQRLIRANSCLFGYEFPSDKLPSFMQMEDLFPLRYDTNTHHLMMCNPSYSTNGRPKSHWQNLFADSDGRYYNHQIGELFAYALGM